MMRCLATSLMTLACGAGAAWAAWAKLPPNARLERLDNGLEVLLLHLPDSPMTGMNLLVKAGSAREDFHTSGMTHMLEHLLFNGTTQLDQAAFYAAVDRIGAYNNANTGRYYTNFMMLAPSAELSRAMDLQSQMIFHSTLPPEKFEKERGIVLEELAQGEDDPAARDEAKWEQVLHAGSSFELPILGTPATIRHMKRDAVWEYYRTWYVPNNMLLSVVGGFDPETVLDEVERWYGQAAPGPLPEHPLRPWNGQPATRTGHTEGGTRTLRLAWPAPDQRHPDHLAAGLLAWAAGDPRDGVLPALLFTEGLPPLANLSLIHVDDVGFGRFELSCTLPPDLDAQEAIEALTRVTARLGSHTFPGETVALRLLDQRAEWSQLIEKPHYFGLMQAAAFTQQGFEPVLTRGARLADLTAADISACAARWLRGQEPLALLLEPAQEAGSARLSLADRHRQPASQDQPAILVEAAARATGSPCRWWPAAAASGKVPTPPAPWACCTACCRKVPPGSPPRSSPPGCAGWAASSPWRTIRPSPTTTTTPVPATPSCVWNACPSTGSPPAAWPWTSSCGPTCQRKPSSGSGTSWWNGWRPRMAAPGPAAVCCWTACWWGTCPARCHRRGAWSPWRP